jgi:hypothetical protein
MSRVMVKLLCAAVACTIAAVGTASAATPLRVDVLSNRADLISGGDALVAVELPAGTNPASVRMTLGSHDVTAEFARRQDGRYEGLVTGLALGANTLTATLASGQSASAVITNHPIGGPVTSGPQVQPWACKNGSQDPQCNAPTTYQYEYKSSVTGQYQTYDPSNPPPDVATTTTQTGQTVPFIIRVETGYEDRDQYQIAALYQPGKPWAPWAPQPQFNHKLLITHGASCGIDHQSSTAPAVTGGNADVALGEGFAVMSTALDNAGHNCNLLTQAESLIMAKEHLVESYGTLRYTIGTGCSGGSLVQQQVANAYPGIYQGILPQCSFPDSWSTGQQLADYHLTRAYFESPSKWGTGIVWTPEQIGEVEGHPNHGNAIIFDSIYWTALANPSGGCAGVPTADDYNAQSNPSGVRCTMQDYMINLFGPRPQSVWTPAERAAGHGFAGIPLDNVGVEYGLEALKRGDITPAQFVDLNAKIGGESIDLQPTTQRFVADDAALLNDYRGGAINETNNLKNVAIIDLRGPDPGAFHDTYRSWTIRARLEQQEGHFPKNHVIWFGPTPLLGDPNYTTEGLQAMDRWLSAVDADHRSVSLQQKMADDRPTDVHDQCSDVSGVEQVAVPGIGPVCELPAVETRFATPRMESGEAITTDQEKCQLRPVRQSDFYPVTFTADEWAQLAKAWPSGVCDYSKPGVHQQPTIPWQTYQDASGHVVYGGQPLGQAPAGSGGGWSDAAFAWWLSGRSP